MTTSNDKSRAVTGGADDARIARLFAIQRAVAEGKYDGLETSDCVIDGLLRDLNKRPDVDPPSAPQRREYSAVWTGLAALAWIGAALLVGFSLS